MQNPWTKKVVDLPLPDQKVEFGSCFTAGKGPHLNFPLVVQCGDGYRGTDRGASYPGNQLDNKKVCDKTVTTPDCNPTGTSVRLQLKKSY